MNSKQRRHRSVQHNRRLKRRYPGLTTYAGIDYGGFRSTANRDPKTGVRYGVINMNALSEWAWESFEDEYTARCPDCGEELTEDIPDEVDEAEADEWYCPCCEKCVSNDDAYSDEPDSRECHEDDITAFVDGSNDVWVVWSKYYTRAQFCSPCAPGAGHLENPCLNGVKTFCLPASWFENDRAPYPVWEVSTDRRVP